VKEETSMRLLSSHSFSFCKLLLAPKHNIILVADRVGNFHEVDQNLLAVD